MTLAQDTRSYSWDESYLHRNDLLDKGRGMTRGSPGRGSRTPTATFLGGGPGPASAEGHDSFVSTSSSSGSPSHPSTPVLLRTNFGKDSAYRPPSLPAAWNHPLSSSPTNPPHYGRAGNTNGGAGAMRTGSNHSYVSQDSEETPFDQRGDKRGRMTSTSSSSSPPRSTTPQRHRHLPSQSQSQTRGRRSASAGDRPFDESQSVQSEDLPYAPPSPPPPTANGSAARGTQIRRVLGTERRGDRHDWRNPPDDVGSGGGTRYGSDSAPLQRQPSDNTDDAMSSEGRIISKASTASTGARGYRSDPEDDDDSRRSAQRRYRMAPPRISDPMLVPFLSNMVVRDEASTEGEAQPARSRSPSYGKNRTSQGRSASLEGRPSSRYPATSKAAAARGSSGRDQPEKGGADEEDNDSIFDFEEESLRQQQKGKKATVVVRKGLGGGVSRRSAAYVSTDEEDDTNGSAPPTTLTERTQQAWRRKSSQRSKPNPADGGAEDGYDEEIQPEVRAPPSPTGKISARSAAAPVDDGAPNAVRFSQHDDTIHHFEPDPDETLDSLTFGGRSLNSEYTKSAESEVEDFIKDILMIGSAKGRNPGRRKIKYSPHAQEKVKHKPKAANPPPPDELEDGTLESDEEEELCAPSEIVEGGGVRSQSQQVASVFCSADDSVDDSKGTGDVSGGARRRSARDAGDPSGNDPLSSVWNYLEGGLSAVSSALGFEDGSQVATPPRRRSTRRSVASSNSPGLDTTGDSVTTASHQGFFDQLLADRDVYTGEKRGRDLQAAPSLEEDVRLVDLALQAARSMHKLRGFEYDESNEINIASDIRFSVVDLSLPLGLIFQENDTGCWVTKVLPDGSAAKCQFIEVGDQLAAIDGVSAIKMSVDDIAGLIRRKSSEIELTFLRYVGPWRPAEGTVAEEGYEVRMQTRRENPMHLPGCGLTGSSKKAVVTSTKATAKSASNKSLKSSTPILRTSARSNPSRSLSPSARPTTKQGSSRNASAAQQQQSKSKKGFWRFGKKKQ